MSTVAIEVKTCPFCGDEANGMFDNGKSGDLCVICDTCGACGPSEKTHDQAVEAWNKRK